MGFGESYTDGWWDSDDLTLAVRFVIRNMSPLMHRLDALARLRAPLTHMWQRMERVDKERDRANIRAHYDLGNDFYSLMLDETMMYSCAYFADEGTSLYDASIAKLEKLCRKISLVPTDHVVEIGSGWGGFALYAAEHYGCRVTTVTISDAQFDHVTSLVAERGLGHLVEVRNQDYRDLSGTYDKLVSIEMIEAIGHQYLGTYFRKVGELLQDDGMALIQAITIEDHRYQQALRSVDFIKRHVFPGSFIPSISSMLGALVRVSDLKLFNLEDIGPSYALTLRAWRQRFLARRDQVLALGYPERLVRMWDYYLAYCEGGFLERATGDVQMLLTKPGARRAQFAPL